MDSTARNDRSLNSTFTQSSTPEVMPPAGTSPNAVPASDDGRHTLLFEDLPYKRIVRGYRLLECLGGGAYGVVYRALSPGGIEVAVKEVRYSLSRPESQRELEALKLLTTLHHPYILSFHDFWTENDQLFIAMDLA